MNALTEGKSVNELKSGIVDSAIDGVYKCAFCGEAFEAGEVFKRDGRLYEAARAAQLHVAHEHGGAFDALLSSGSKYIALTDNQKKLLERIHMGMTDAQIAGEMGVAASTIRHQRFMFREKAKQASMFLALFELAFDEQPETERMLPVHEGARMVDERYATTYEQSEKYIAAAFESLSPLRLKSFSGKEKKKIVILKRIADEFKRGDVYTEKEVSRILKPIYGDFATLRRYLIEYGFMERTADGKKYWLK